MDSLVEDRNEIEALERELRTCLGHVPAPDNFTERVMARVAERERRRTTESVARRSGLRGSLFGTPARAWWTAAAAALVLAVGGGDAVHVRHQHQERQATAVQAQMDLAMRLTSHAMSEVETGLDQSPAGRFVQLGSGN